MMPYGYVLSSLRRILCGRIKESVDLLCSQREKPTLEEVLGRVRKYSNLHRVDLTLRKRNDVHVDEARGEYGQGNGVHRQWQYQGKGPSPWGTIDWRNNNYEPPGYAFRGGESPSDDWGGKQEGDVAAFVKRQR